MLQESKNCIITRNRPIHTNHWCGAWDPHLRRLFSLVSMIETKLPRNSDSGLEPRWKGDEAKIRGKVKSIRESADLAGPFLELLIRHDNLV